MFYPVIPAYMRTPGKTKGAPTPASAQRARQLAVLVKQSRTQTGEFVAETNAYLYVLFPARRALRDKTLDSESFYLQRCACGYVRR